MSTPVEQIKERLPILEVAKTYFKVEKAGRNFKARCPFHSEKTPSFFISPERNTYYCFGCGAKGDVFSLVQQFEGLDFRGALVELAKRAHVPLEDTSSNREYAESKDIFYSLHEEATFFYEQCLQERPDIVEYLQSRGLREEHMRGWRLGYAKDEWRSLYDHLVKKGYRDRDIERAGLIKKAEARDGSSNQRARWYDRFRNRIMFPIGDASGRIMAFSGRLHATASENKDATAPKYLNSPETPIFHKSKTLYGLDRAKGVIRKSDFSIVVEGQMDLLLMHQIGFSNAVATSGTSLTEDHLRVLKRFSDNVVLAMDGDEAGHHSSVRGAALALPLGMNVKIAEFPESHDPADVAGNDVLKAKHIIKESQHVIDYLMMRIQKQGYDARKFRLTVQKEVFPFVAMIENRIDREHFIQKIAQKIALPEEALREELKRAPKTYVPEMRESSKDMPQQSALPQNVQVRDRLIGLLLMEESKSEKSIDTSALRGILEKYGTVPILTELRSEDEVLLYETEKLYEERGLVQEEAAELVKVLERAYIKATYQDRLIELKRAEEMRDAPEVERLLNICRELSNELEKLKTV